MALEISTLLRGVTIDVGGANSLGELEHFAAFEVSLDRFLKTLLVWCAAETAVSVRATRPFSLEIADYSLSKFVDQGGLLAHSLYYSDNDEFEMLLSTQSRLTLVARVVMDPILFYLTPSPAHRGT